METPPHNEAASSPWCLNCGAAVAGNYCASCGQETRVRKKSLGLLLHELAENVFNLDSKLVRSVVPLLVRPGFLTRAYLDGKRASYVLPLRLYLIVSVLLFLGFSLPRPNAETMKVTIDSVPLKSGQEAEPAEPRGQDEPAEPRSQDKPADRPGGQQAGGTAPIKVKYSSSLNLPTFGRQDKHEELLSKDPEVIVELYFSKLEAAIPKGLFLLMPLFALVLKLLFLRSRILYFDHLIFALHFHSFIFLLCLAAYVFQRPVWMVVFVLVLSTVYLVLALRRVYGCGWVGSLVRTAVLVLAYMPMCLLSIEALAFYAALLM